MPAFLSREDHLEYLELIEMGGQSHSITYGVNCRSPLLDLTGFDVTKCLPYDIMHTIFEGVATHHLHALLPYLIDEKKFITLNQLNSLLRTHNYSQSEEKPSPIRHDSGTYHIKQSGTCTCTENANRITSLLYITYTCSFSNDESDTLASFPHWQ